MAKRSVIIAISVIAAIIVLAGLSVLIWWLVTRNTDSDPVTEPPTTTPPPDFVVEQLEGEGIGDLEYTAAFTKIRSVGDIFWWFYPTISGNAHTRPLILWLDGVTGIPPSLLANLGMFGPYDINLNRRQGSWIEQYNLLFIDAPLGTGFSTPIHYSVLPEDIESNAEHLAITLESFYTVHEQYRNTPLHIFGQGHGAALAAALAVKLHKSSADSNLRGVVLGNGIISPALAMTKLGFYLEELGYIDAKGRAAIETLSEETMDLATSGEYLKLEDAFDKFTSLGQFVNEHAGAVAVNLGHIVEKLTNPTDLFGLRQYLKDVLKQTDLTIMDKVIAPALGIPSTITYDSYREWLKVYFKATFMIPAIDEVEYILQNTGHVVTIYNGNLDAVSNTPGQLEWVNNLVWPGQDGFRAAPRETLVVDGVIEGYFRNGGRLQFYWVNVAGHSVPLDNPAAMNVILRRTLGQ